MPVKKDRNGLQISTSEIDKLEGFVTPLVLLEFVRNQSPYFRTGRRKPGESLQDR